MEAYQDQLINIALNVAGYLAGGGLWLVVYSSWRDRASRADRHATASADSPSVPTPSAAAGLTVAAADIEFLDLRAVPTPLPTSKATEPPRPKSAASRRNHGEVFALARTMLEKGASTDTIKATVPISDGELALLTGK